MNKIRKTKTFTLIEQSTYIRAISLANQPIHSKILSTMSQFPFSCFWDVEISSAKVIELPVKGNRHVWTLDCKHRGTVWRLGTSLDPPLLRPLNVFHFSPWKDGNDGLLFAILRIRDISLWIKLYLIIFQYFSYIEHDLEIGEEEGKEAKEHDGNLLW